MKMGKQEIQEMEMLFNDISHHSYHHHQAINDDDDDNAMHMHPYHHHHGNAHHVHALSLPSYHNSLSSSSSPSSSPPSDLSGLEEFGLLDKLIDWTLNGDVDGDKKIQSLPVLSDFESELGVKTSGDDDFQTNFYVDNKNPFVYTEPQDFVEPELGFRVFEPQSVWTDAGFDSSNLHYVYPVSERMTGAHTDDDYRALSCRWSANTCHRVDKGGIVLCGKGSDVRKESSVQKIFEELIGVEGCIYSMVKDQNGCRFLQRKFDEGKDMVDVIFDGVIDHVVELMMHPFGNYLMQKLLEVCREEQRMEILVVLTERLRDVVDISLNIHGTRAVQKLIDTLKTKQQRALIISALRLGILDLIKDLNGNHVVQRCLESFTVVDNKFIFDAAAKHCVEIATHRHGCCVLQRCIDSSTGEYKNKMITEICANAFELARDPFGNYVVQYILKLKNLLALASLPSRFEGKYVQLSVQKFSSNVIEKCLKFFAEDDRATIISEFLSVPHFEQLLQDPYANYVVQSALHNCKGSLRATLTEAIRPHAATLRTNPYCKRIFSRGLLMKPCGC